ncbi:MAG: hypothetical protein WCP19_14940, partial [Chloroflexota bacterium]
MKTKIFISYVLFITLFLSSCNLPLNKTTPANTVITTPKIMETKAADLPLQITSPENNQSYPYGSPIQVKFNAAGGPFIEFDMYIDDVLIYSKNITDPEKNIADTFRWESPSSGLHTLKIQSLDMNKNISSSQVQVTVLKKNEIIPTTSSSQDNGLQIRFANMADGDSVTGSLDGAGNALVPVQVEVSGGTVFAVNMKANGLKVPGELANSQNAAPFSGQFNWAPAGGAGEYTLVIEAITMEKQSGSAEIHITVTGIPVFTATPPPLSRQEAQTRFAKLYKELYQIDVPKPSVHRFDSAERPDLSRWISAVYYKGIQHYIDLYDNGRHEESGSSDYATADNKNASTGFILCKPAGTYKILVVFVDYGNEQVDMTNAINQAMQAAADVNTLYGNFASRQGTGSAILKLDSRAVSMKVQNRGKLLTSAEIQSGTGVDPRQFDIVMEVDFDTDNTIGKANWKGVLDQGGGIALQGCGKYYDGDVNIWSNVKAGEDVRGVLLMDFDHELSHLFGMYDNYPRMPITLGDGTVIDDWITYELFGWSDADGDGIPEIIDDTPYGTSGP